MHHLQKASACLKSKLFQLRCLPRILNALISGFSHEGRVIVILGFVLEHKVKKTLNFTNPEKEKKVSLLSLLTATQILEEEKASTFFGMETLPDCVLFL